MSGPRVLVVLDVFAAWSRGILKGFAEVADELGWTLLHYHPDLDLHWLLRTWKPDATVLMAHDATVASLAGATVVVSVNHDATRHGYPSVVLDEHRIGKLACEHLLKKGLRHLTTFRFDDSEFAEARTRAFVEAAISKHAHVAPGWWRDNAVPARTQEVPAALVKWLRDLPKPCGIFAATDTWARVVARYAQAGDFHIPEAIALLGADNDVVQCELTSPWLSSVAIPWRSMGQQAANLVRLGLSGKTARSRPVVIAPVDVVARRSTDVTAVTSPEVARAIAWIGEHSSRKLTLLSVARAVGVSRQRLERLFHASIGRTVMQEVRRSRVTRAKSLLSTTSNDLSTIAKLSGFSTLAMLSVAVRADTGMPPSVYRRRFQGLYLDQV